MPVFHFILHGYGTWNADNPKGWHQHGEPGPLKPAPKIAAYRKARQRWPTVSFSDGAQFQLIERVLDVCQRRAWRCHAAAANETHVHIVTSWRTHHFADTVQAKLKNLLAVKMGQFYNESGRQWFSEGGKSRAVVRREHFDFLINEYLPSQGGRLWREGDGSPIKV